ncbi:MAG: hypothetical protein P8H17_05870 [Flavobacteriales bacterium]|nr:hypothetical protein [Flavobacteriales bacterium]
MKLNFYKKNPKRILGYIMAFAIVCLNYNTANAQCINTSQYASAVLPGPTATGPTTISTCNYQTEYSPLSGAVAGYTYTCENVTAGGYITMTQGTPTGTVVNHGPSPLTWTAGVAGTYYVHWTVNSSCATATSCNTTQVSFITSSTNLVFGCTDSLALNYDTSATVNDGSCTYYMGCMDTLALNFDSLAVQDSGCVYPCVSGYQEESFENGLTGTIWENDNSNNPIYGWLNGNYGTSSTNTGPSAAFDSTDYMYVETSGSGINTNFYLNSRCVDLSAYTDPALVFAYHMYGATMGTLSVDISLDTGATWTSIWSLSGDQGDQWTETVVSLSAYSGDVYVRFNFLTGSSYTSDCALDLVRFMESPSAGCMDPFASNYDSTATISDNSCLYPGCLDIYATNYCASCNVNDSLSCVYPTCNTLDICEDFESASFSTNGWVTNSGSLSSVSLNSANAIIDTVSLEFTGGDTYYPTQSTDSAAFSNPDHLSSATICLDLSGSSAVDLNFSAEIGGTSTNRAWFRVKVEGSVIADKNGTTAFSSSTVSSGLNLYEYDLSAYAGNSSVHVTFESMCNYSTSYTTNADYVWIDNVCAFEVFPCTYYAVNTTSTDVTCNAGSDGSVSAIVIGMDTNLTYNNSYVWIDTSGTVGTTASVSGLAAGTYTCIASDNINGCSASSSITISEPTPIAFTAVVTTSTTPTQNNGSVDITVAGGTPCATSVQVGSGTVSSYQSYLWYTWYMDGHTEITYPAAELAALGMSSGDIMDELAWNIITLGSGMTMTNSEMTVNGISVYTGDYTPVAGMNNFVFSTPVTYTGGDLVVTWCFDNASYLSGNNMFESTMISGTLSNYSDLSTASGCTALTPSISRTYRPNAYIGFQSASAYTFAWSNGDTTEDAYNLGIGPVAVTVTDCNGCTSAWSGFIIATTVPGCTDPTAFNYNPVANVDDSSCIAVVIGCMDTTAFNYDTLANTNDSTLCVPFIYGCTDPSMINYNSLANVSDSSCAMCTGLVVAPYIETFDSVGYLGSFNQSTTDQMNWTQDNYGTGSFNTGPSDDITGGGYYMYTEASGFNNQTAMLYSECIDISQLSCPSMRFSYHMYGATMGTLRGIVNGDTLFTMSGDQGNQWNETQINLSAYTGLIRIDFVGVTGTSFTSDIAIDQIIVDECIAAGCMDSTAYNYDSTAAIDDGSCLYVMGCTDPLSCNYDSLAVMDDGSCYILSASASSTNVLCASDSNGTATATTNATGVSYLWSNGQTSATISNLSPGTYSVSITDTLGCMSNDSTTVSSPSVITASFTVGNESASGAADGQIDLSISGGVPCATSIQVGSGTTSSYLHRLFYTYYHDGKTQMTYEATELAALGMNSGDIIDELAWNILSQDGSASTTPMNGANLSVNGVNVWSGTYQAVLGMNNFVFSTPITYTGGDLVVEWCYDNTSYLSGNNYFECTSVAANLCISQYQDNAVGCSFTNLTSYSLDRPNAYLGFQAASGYTFAWSTGDTTEDISGLSAGGYCVTVTDCNGCTTTACDSVGVSATLGCMDPLACNYNAVANTDDGSCTYPGCTDTLACNYDSLAGCDDGSCTLPVPGYVHEPSSVFATAL